MRLRVLGLALVAACSSAVGPQPGDDFQLRVGETASFPELGFRVRFIEVTPDSRCPTGVACVWAGDAGVVLETAPLRGDARTDTLHTTLEPRALPLGTFALRLVALEPYPVEGQVIATDEYVALLTTDPVR